MREIKFRAWDIKNEIMTPAPMSKVYRNKYSLFGDIYLLEKEAFEDTVRVELMQYTGLKDKNGVETYEGDIVEADIGGIENFEIRFVKGRFTMKAVESDENSLWILDEKCKIIGNIYENPELLEVAE